MRFALTVLSQINPGVLPNLRDVFGSYPWLWILPTLARNRSSIESDDGDEEHFVHSSIQHHQQLVPLHSAGREEELSLDDALG